MCDLWIRFQKSLKASQSQDKIMAFNLIQEAFLDIENEVQDAFKILNRNLLRKTHY